MPSLPSKQSLFIALAIASLVVMEAVVIVGGRLAEDAINLRRHTLKALIAISEVNERKDHTESLVREFVQTGEASLGSRALANLAEIRARLAHARQLMGDETNQVRLLDRLDATVKELTSRFTLTIETRRTAGVDAATKFVSDGVVRRLTDEAEFILDEMTAEENQLLAERSARAARYSDLCNHAAKAGGVLTVLFGFLAWRALRRQTREREVAALHLAHLHQRQALVFNSVGDGLHGLDLDGTINFQNAAAERMLGLSKGEVLGRHAHATMHHHRADGSEYPVANCPIYATLRDGQMRTVRDEVFWRKDGTSFPVEYVVSPITDEKGRQLGAIVAFRDVTERKRAQEEVDRFFALSLDMLCIAGADGYFKRVSPAFTTTLGWSEEEMLARPFLDFVHPDDRAATVRVVGTLTAGQPTLHFENRYAHKDGSWRVLSWRAVPQPGGLIYATARDVTEAASLAKALRASEAYNRSIIESSPDCLKLLSLDARLLYMAPAGCRLMEVDDFCMLENADWLAFWKGDGQAAAQSAVEAARAGSTGRFSGFCPTAKGSPRWWDVAITPILGPDGKPEKLLAVSRDITERNRMEEEVRASEVLIRTVLDSMMANIAVVDREGTIIAINEGWERFARENGAETTLHGVGVGTNYLEVCARATRDLGDEAREILEGIRGVLVHSKATYRHEYACHSPTEHRWFSMQVSALDRAEGGAVIAQINITQRKRAEQMLSDFKAALDEHAIVAITDARGKITYVNDKFCAISKYPCEELLGQDHRIVNSGHHPKAFIRELWETIGSGRVWKGEIKNRAKDGWFYWVDTTIVPFLGADGKPTQFISIRADISKRKLAEETLRTALDELSRANAELDDASRHKDEFLANMSHELRTPLNAILGMSELLTEQLFGPLTPRQAKSVTTISTSGQYLLALINDILDLSKIEAGKMELHAEPLNVDEFCQSCLAFVRTQAMQKQISVVFEQAGSVARFTADPKRFKQILVNLLTNAVKFTPNGGRIGLTVAAPADEEVVRFTVWDSGIGIAPADQAKLFRAFTQVDSGLNRTQEGTGLGLALVAKLVELHGGSVALESEPGKGSRFIVTLPVGSVGTPSAPRPDGTTRDNDFFGLSASQPSGTPPAFHRALIIEDDPTAGEQLVHHLTQLGLSTVVHERGEESVEVVLRERPDFILLDLQLPGASGWVVLTRLKEHPQTRDIPVVTVSVMDEPEKSRALGAAAHFTKPVTRDQLAALLQRPLSPKAEPTPPPAPRATASGPTILLAEDNEANIETLGSYLKAKGYDMHFALNGLTAVKLARELRPALILMDIQMPMMDGLTAIRELRADAAFKDVPIIALTALAMAGDRERCIAAGATEYLSKPVKLKELAALVEKLVGKPAEGGGK